MVTETKRMPVVRTTIEDGVLIVAVEGVGQLTVDPKDMPTAVNEYAVLHGYKQKIVDAAAIERDPATGRPATPRAKFDAMSEVWESLQAGAWNRTGSGDGTVSDGLLISALVEYLGQPAEAVRAAVAGWDKRTQAAMRTDPAIAPIVARLRTERDAARGRAVDTGALLRSMGA
jgi:hypothetical protein